MSAPPISSFTKWLNVVLLDTSDSAGSGLGSEISLVAMSFNLAYIPGDLVRP